MLVGENIMSDGQEKSRSCNVMGARGCVPSNAGGSGIGGAASSVFGTSACWGTGVCVPVPSPTLRRKLTIISRNVSA
jgi:hypothetical protein